MRRGVARIGILKGLRAVGIEDHYFLGNARFAANGVAASLRWHATGGTARGKALREKYLARASRACLHLGCGSMSSKAGSTLISLHETLASATSTQRDDSPFVIGRSTSFSGEHMMEHLTFSQGQRMLAECLRVLRPCGTLGLATPDPCS